jgi:hypothetical protein
MRIMKIVSVLLIALSLWAYVNFTSAPALRMLPWLIDNFTPFAAIAETEKVMVDCPSEAYELETFAVEVIIPPPPGNTAPTPHRFRVEVPEQIQVQGDKDRQIRGRGSWYLTPKEQGEFVVVISGEKGFEFHKRIGVHRIDHLSRREFTALVAFGAILGVVGTFKKIFSKSDRKQHDVEDKPKVRPEKKDDL